MNDYIELRLNTTPCNEMVTDILAALLCDRGYESFVADSDGLTAYIKSELFDAYALETLNEELPLNDITLKFEHSLIEGKDWNHEWEKNYFQPIVIGGNRCVIHSSFHTGFPKCEYDIVIDPKMAFGTGHHSTTSLIISHILEMDFTGRSVLDMGTGTGILAILSAMRGARKVTGIEIDPMAYENAVENVRANNHPEIEMILGDAEKLANLDKVDFMYANINRNIILSDIERYVSVLKKGSRLLLSGFYTEDVPVLMEVARKYGLENVSQREMNNWCCLQLELTK